MLLSIWAEGITKHGRNRKRTVFELRAWDRQTDRQIAAMFKPHMGGTHNRTLLKP